MDVPGGEGITVTCPELELGESGVQRPGFPLTSPPTCPNSFSVDTNTAPNGTTACVKVVAFGPLGNHNVNPPTEPAAICPSELMATSNAGPRLCSILRTPFALD